MPPALKAYALLLPISLPKEKKKKTKDDVVTYACAIVKSVVMFLEELKSKRIM